MRTPQFKATGNSANRKKIFIGLAILGCTSAIAIGGSLAFFSDTLTSTNTAKAGTLDISMLGNEYKMYVNGSSTGVSTIGNLNPGDVVVVKGDIKNLGNKSAWLTESFDFSGNMPNLSKIKVYRGEWTQANIGTATGPVTITGSAGSGSATASAIVINGTGTNAEIETNVSGGGTVPNGTTISSAADYDTIFTIYFDKTADNTYQGKDLNVNVKVRAMQYRNNPTPIWTDVVSVPFGS